MDKKYMLLLTILVCSGASAAEADPTNPNRPAGLTAVSIKATPSPSPLPFPSPFQPSPSPIEFDNFSGSDALRMTPSSARPSPLPITEDNDDEFIFRGTATRRPTALRTATPSPSSSVASPLSASTLTMSSASRAAPSPSLQSALSSTVAAPLPSSGPVRFVMESAMIAPKTAMRPKAVHSPKTVHSIAADRPAALTQLPATGAIGTVSGKSLGSHVWKTLMMPVVETSFLDVSLPINDRCRNAIKELELFLLSNPEWSKAILGEEWTKWSQQFRPREVMPPRHILEALQKAISTDTGHEHALAIAKEFLYGEISKYIPMTRYHSDIHARRAAAVDWKNPVHHYDISPKGARGPQPL